MWCKRCKQNNTTALAARVTRNLRGGGSAAERGNSGTAPDTRPVLLPSLSPLSPPPLLPSHSSSLSLSLSLLPSLLRLCFSHNSLLLPQFSTTLHCCFSLTVALATMPLIYYIIYNVYSHIYPPLLRSIISPPPSFVRPIFVTRICKQGWLWPLKPGTKNSKNFSYHY